jgi:uncharacterized protein (DUF433 family)
MERICVMAKEYVEKRGEGYYVVGNRVSLDSIVYRFLEGYSPESIVESFSSLTLQEFYGALAFYLANRAAIDAYLATGALEGQRRAGLSRAENPLLYRRLEQAKRSADLQKHK